MSTPVTLSASTEAWLWSHLLPVMTLLSACPALPAMAAPFFRFRRAHGLERAQLSFFASASAVSIALGALGDLLPGPVGGYVWALATALPAVAIAASVQCQRLFDLDPLLNRGVVYASLTALFVAASALLGLLPDGARLGEIVVAMAAVSLTALPLRTWLQNRVDRFFYGDAAEPYLALSRRRTVR